MCYLLAALMLLVAAAMARGEDLPVDDPPPPADAKWVELFDGRTLEGWESTNFGGEGDVKVENGRILFGMGEPMTGITYVGKKPLPKMNYEIVVVAMRVDGDDFFAGTTFPVKDSHCSFINGGWGGTVVGLSNIDDQDAFRNETCQFVDFKQGEWYEFRVRITPERIRAWINNKRYVDQPIEGKKIDTRDEVDKSKPFGISAYQVRSAVKTIKIRELK